MALQLFKLDTTELANKGSEMIVSDPITGEPTDAVLVLAGTDSERWKSAKLALQEKRLKASQKGKVKLSIKDMEDEALELLCQVVLDWRGIEMEEGVEYPCTPENVRTVLTTFGWLKDAVDHFVGDRQNFMRA
jgi:hypothetical protein